MDELSTGAPSGFDPVYVTEDVLADLADFTGMSREACLERLRSYSPVELADAWHRSVPRTPDELLNFYRSTDLYVWDLLQWHASQDRQEHRQVLEELTARFPAASGYARVYDFGAGVGTDALFLASRGYDVTLVDVDSPAFRFARRRFERRGLQARFVESTSQLPEPDQLYDIIVCFDVFEHLPDPLAAARRLTGALRPDGLLVQEADFSHDHDHPQHLEHGARRFEEPRWHIHLSGMGLKQIDRFVYRRLTGARQFAVRARFAFWRATGLWVTPVPRRTV